jgi:hypothetical protein
VCKFKRIKSILQQALRQEKYPRDIDDIKIIPWKIFLEMLWAGEFGI